MNFPTKTWSFTGRSLIFRVYPGNLRVSELESASTQALAELAAPLAFLSSAGPVTPSKVLLKSNRNGIFFSFTVSSGIPDPVFTAKVKELGWKEGKAS